MQPAEALAGQEQASKIMNTKRSTPRPRLQTRINVLHDDATIYSLDNTKRKRRIPAEVIVAIRENERIAQKLGHNPAHVTELFSARKVWRMMVRAINKGKLFTYREENLSEDQHLNTTPSTKSVSIDKEFRKRQRESVKNYGKRIKQKTQASAQVFDLQVA